MTKITQVSILPLLFLVGCGDGDQCKNQVSDYATPTCAASITFAGRDTSRLIASDEEVSLYHNIWMRVVDRLPLLERFTPLAGGATARFRVYTKNRAIAAAAQEGSLATGVSAFDTLVADLENPVLSDRSNVLDSDEYSFEITTESFASVRNLNSRLKESDSRTDEPIQLRMSDARWHWSGHSDNTVGTLDDAVSIDIAVGWGDCVSGCIYFHSFRADFERGEGGSLDLMDQGGDVLPDTL